MNRYTIYCTPGQARKALELGASLYRLSMSVDDSHLRDKSIRVEEENELVDYAIPTAEQMILWMEEKLFFSFTITKDFDGLYLYVVRDKKRNIISKQFRYDSRKKATLASIDAALEYLSNNKK